MNKKLLAVLVLGFACMAFALQTNAGPITGKVDFFGNLSTDTGNLDTAHSFTAFSGVGVTSNPPFTPTGSYAGTGGAAVTMHAFSFNPFVAPVPNLWTFTVGALTYNFSLTSIVSVSQPGNQTLTVVGMGIATITGGGSFDPTAGQFFISTQGPNSGSFTFSSTTTAIPEGGSALALLGIGLVAVEVLRRKLATA